MGNHLLGVKRCPHCLVAAPLLYQVWASPQNAIGTPRADGGKSTPWAAYLCSSCGGGVFAQAYGHSSNLEAEYIYPKQKAANAEIPDVPRRYLQQAFDTLSSPDASAVMAGAAVDAMLKAMGYNEGSLYTRIDKALQDNLLTKGMAEWAHSVRLESNRPRHADTQEPHVSLEEAKQSVEFAEALGDFLFVLTAKIEKGIKGAG
jgi:hypothetical protein